MSQFEELDKDLVGKIFFKEAETFEINKNWNIDTKFLILINFYDGEIEWRKRLKFPHIVYTKNTPSREPYDAINKAKSETNLLKFIVDFYDRLPKHVINVHQYEYKEYSHEGSIVDILNQNDFEQKYNENKSGGYWNFCSYIMGHASRQVERMLECGWWQNCMEPWFGCIHAYHDFTLNKKGCAQFVVSRERILSLPKNFYANMYKWLCDNSTGLPRGDGPQDGPFSNIWTSRYMEWTWQLIFSTQKKRHNYVEIFPKYELYAQYGLDNYQIDVTELFLKECFLSGNRIFIPNDLQFNKLFGDPLCNSLKYLMVFILKNKNPWYETIIPEQHESTIIDLN